MDAVESDTRGEITLSADVTADCPYDHLVDEYVVTVVYRPDVLEVELASFKSYLESFESTEISQEGLAEVLFNQVKDTLNPLSLTVTVTGEHYGVDVEVRRSL